MACCRPVCPLIVHTGTVHLHEPTGLVIQVHGGVGLCRTACAILDELGRLVRNLSGRFALVALFQPEQIQGDAAVLELLVNIGVAASCRRTSSAGRKQTGRDLFVRHFLRQRLLQAAVCHPLQRLCHGVPSAPAACRNLSFAEPQAVALEDLTVIGHICDLLADIYAAKTVHIYILPSLDSGSQLAQPSRNDCSISEGHIGVYIGGDKEQEKGTAWDFPRRPFVVLP